MLKQNEMKDYVIYLEEGVHSKGGKGKIVYGKVGKNEFAMFSNLMNDDEMIMMLRNTFSVCKKFGAEKADNMIEHNDSLLRTVKLKKFEVIKL